jgi:ArsR family transcriptional regulator
MDTASLIKLAKALSDPHRLSLLQEIARNEQMRYCDLLECVPISQPSMSQHLKALVEAGLVDSEKVGRSLHLTINRAKLQELEDFLQLLKLK